MLDSKWADFWWENITGASIVVSNVVSALLANRTVILEVPSDLPWRYQLRTAVELSFRQAVNYDNYVIQIIDDADECCASAPGTFLLEHFAKSRDVRMGYRSAAKATIQKYIADNKVLYGTVVWVKGLEKKRAKEWVDFCREFESSINNGIFLLEIKDSCDALELAKASCVRYSDSISRYDVQLFNSLILSEMNLYNTNWKQYISALVASLCDTDAEISAELVAGMDFKTTNPIDGIADIEESGDFDRRGKELDSKHILSLVRSSRTEEIQSRIWNAQIQVLFPLIEMERLHYISSYYEEIQNALQVEQVTQFDEILEVPNEVELGTLNYLIKGYKIAMPSVGDRERISFLRECRNKLAHRNCCSVEEVSRLIDYTVI